MPSFNRVMMIGNLTRDPQVKQLPSQTVVAEFGLAMSRKYRTASGEDKEEVCFVDCAAFGKQAETIVQWCRKGKPLFVEGRLKFDTWEDRAGGGKRSKVSVVVENFQFLGHRDDTNGSPAGSYPGTTGNMFEEREKADRSERRPALRRQRRQVQRSSAGRAPRGRATVR